MQIGCLTSPPLMVVLKNLGHWLGLPTLGRDITISTEAADNFSQRLSGLTACYSFCSTSIGGWVMYVVQFSSILIFPSQKHYFCLC